MVFLERYLRPILIGCGIGLLAAVALYVFHSMQPREFTILTGRDGGGYFQAAVAYQTIAAANGFHLAIRLTAGSLETLRLLEAGEAGIGFVQGGVASTVASGELSSMAGVFYE